MKRYGFQNIGRVILPLEDSFVRKLSEGGVHVHIYFSCITPHDQMSSDHMGVPPAEFKKGNSLWKSTYLARL